MDESISRLADMRLPARISITLPSEEVMKSGVLISLLLLVSFCASCGRQEMGTNLSANKPAGTAMVLKPWDFGSWSFVRDAVRNPGSNDVRMIRDILLSDKYWADIRKDPSYKRYDVSYYLHWQQSVAVEAAQRPDVFGTVLISYYFGSPEELQSLSPEDQVIRATLALIQQVDENGMPYGVFDYDVQEVTLSGDTAEVEAAFMKPLAGRGYIIHFQKFRLVGKDVWLPVKQTPTWLS